MVGSAGRRPRVLVIEDDAAISEILDLVVADCGCDVLLAASLDQVSPVASPDLVITDLLVAFPRDAAQRYLARVRARFPGAPILLLTAHAWVLPAYGALAVDGVLLKPFDLAELTHTLVALLSRTREPA